MKTSRPIKACERNNLIKTAKKAGFSEEGLRTLFTLMNVPVREMDFETYKTVLPFINEINAAKFS